MNEDQDTRTYTVLTNDEEQYSLWLADKEIPEGWKKQDIVGSKQECTEYVDRNWTDMRPKSLRIKMEAATSS